MSALIIDTDAGTDPDGADSIGRTRIEPDGAPVRLSASVDYDAFLRWLHRWVGP